MRNIEIFQILVHIFYSLLDCVRRSWFINSWWFLDDWIHMFHIIFAVNKRQEMWGGGKYKPCLEKGSDQLILYRGILITRTFLIWVYSLMKNLRNHVCRVGEINHLFNFRIFWQIHFTWKNHWKPHFLWFLILELLLKCVF